MMDKRTVLGISCGVGVPLFPFKDQNIVGCLEGRSDFRLNKKQPQVELNFPEIKDNPWNGSQKVDIIIGHPKCGNSSMLALSRGKKMTSHKGEPSLDSFIQGIQTYMPDVWLMENLPGLLNSYSIEDFDNLFGNMYIIQSFIANASDFGNSQTTRKRLIITGVHRNLKGCEVLAWHLGSPFKVAKPRITRHLLRNLPSNGHFRENLDDEVTLYAGTKKTWRQIQEMWLDIYPKRHIPTPEENFNTAPGVYINWSANTPLVARKSNRQFNPQGLPMSPRELCRIQGIPDDFLLLEPKQGLAKTTAINKGRVVAGNTPPYEVALWFKRVLQSTKYL